jgi:hypothetical protein
MPRQLTPQELDLLKTVNANSSPAQVDFTNSLNNASNFNSSGQAAFTQSVNNASNYNANAQNDFKSTLEQVSNIKPTENLVQTDNLALANNGNTLKNKAGQSNVDGNNQYTSGFNSVSNNMLSHVNNTINQKMINAAPTPEAPVSDPNSMNQADGDYNNLYLNQVRALSPANRMEYNRYTSQSALNNEQYPMLPNIWMSKQTPEQLQAIQANAIAKLQPKVGGLQGAAEAMQGNLKPVQEDYLGKFRELMAKNNQVAASQKVDADGGKDALLNDLSAYSQQTAEGQAALQNAIKSGDFFGAIAASKGFRSAEKARNELLGQRGTLVNQQVKQASEEESRLRELALNSEHSLGMKNMDNDTRMNELSIKTKLDQAREERDRRFDLQKIDKAHEYSKDTPQSKLAEINLQVASQTKAEQDRINGLTSILVNPKSNIADVTSANEQLLAEREKTALLNSIKGAGTKADYNSQVVKPIEDSEGNVLAYSTYDKATGKTGEVLTPEGKAKKSQNLTTELEKNKDPVERQRLLQAINQLRS